MKAGIIGYGFGGKIWSETFSFQKSSILNILLTNLIRIQEINTPILIYKKQTILKN